MRLQTLVAAFLAVTVPLVAAEFNVSSAAELKVACGRVAPGDVVVLAAGTWRDQALAFRGRGTEDHPITFRAATPGGVVLVGRSTVVIDGEWLVAEGILIKDGTGPGEGIAIKGKHNRLTSSAMVGGTYKHFLRMFGQDSRVDHCYFAGKTSQEPTFQVESEASGPNRHRIDHNHFGPRPPLGRNGGETMRIGYSGQSMNVSRTLVEDNLFDRCDGEIEIISSKSCENVYRHNTFLACGGMLTLRHGNRCVVEGNFFLGHHKKDSGGIRVIGEDHVIINNYIEGVQRGAFWLTAGVPNSALYQYYVAKRCTIAFNTVVDSAGPCVDQSNGLGGAGRTLKPEAITIANNVFAPGAKGQLVIGEHGVNWTWEGNLVAGPAEPAHAGIRAVDLKLVRAADGQFRPAGDSPARGAAVGGFPSVTTDIDGQQRGSTKDVGCDEASTAPVVYRPLTAADVGPAWLAR